jgi:hypothetical protein
VRKNKIKRLATGKPREEIMSQENQEDIVINTNGGSFCVPSQMQPPLQNHVGLQRARSTLQVFLSCIQPVHCFFCFICNFTIFFIFLLMSLSFSIYVYFLFCNFISHCYLLLKVLREKLSMGTTKTKNPVSNDQDSKMCNNQGSEMCEDPKQKLDSQLKPSLLNSTQVFFF